MHKHTAGNCQNGWDSGDLPSKKGYLLRIRAPPGKLCHTSPTNGMTTWPSSSMNWAELSIGDLQFRITELRNGYQRRVTTELRETERLLLELTVTLPAAHRLRAAYARQKAAQGGISSRTGNAAATKEATVESTATVN